MLTRPASDPRQARFGHTVIETPRGAPDEGEVQRALSAMAGGVAIVAWLDGGAPRGVVAASVAALSSDPPRALFCVDKARCRGGGLLRAQGCGLSILGEADAEEARRCWGPEGARLEGPDWRSGPAAPPVFRRALAGLMGKISHRIDADAHALFILDITAVETRPGRPLIAFAGALAALAPAPRHPEIASPRPAGA